MTRLHRRPELRAGVLFGVLLIALAFTQPTVFSSYAVVLKTAAVTALVAAGLTAVLVQGELDLSVGSMVALSGALVATTSHSLVVGGLIAILAGVAVGLLNGMLVTRVGVNSFIATLATMIALGGLALVITDGTQVPIKNLGAGISFGENVLGSLTPRILITIVGVAALHLFLSRTRIGREFYAIGGNRAAAQDADIPTQRRIVLGFVICGVAAALAGVMLTIELTTADPNAGSTVLLNAIAAAVIGGASLSGGRGTVLGTLIGAVGLAALTVGLEFGGISPNIQDMVVGIVLILAVSADGPTLLRLLRTERWYPPRASAEDVTARSGQ
jgi:ribose/xylose/arabinose/galactoside ABC-type transport system permease subunit